MSMTAKQYKKELKVFPKSDLYKMLEMTKAPMKKIIILDELKERVYNGE